MTIPAWLANPTRISNSLEDVVGLENVQLDDRLRSSLRASGIEALFPIQAQVIKETASRERNRDICVAVPTGSGKTLSYLLPILNDLAGRMVIRLRALIVVPGRELAEQVHGVLAPLAASVGLQTATAIGQTSMSAEQRRIVSEEDGSSLIDILVATPGRLSDHLRNSKHFTLRHLQWLVLDEADRLFEDPLLAHDFIPLLFSSLSSNIDRASLAEADCSADAFMSSTRQANSWPTREALSFRKVDQVPCEGSLWLTPLRKILCSATLSQNAAKLASLDLHVPLFICPEGENGHGMDSDTEVGEIKSEKRATRYQVPSGLVEYLHVCKEERKPVMLLHLLQNQGLSKALCFTKSVQTASRLALLLQTLLPQQRIASFSALLSAPERRDILESFSAGNVDLLVCSDAATRGLDLHNVAAVINYDVPKHLKTYVHRVGRTARAGRSGVAYTLAAIKEAHHFKRLHQQLSLTSTLSSEDSSTSLRPLKLPKGALQDLLPKYNQLIDESKD